jgi:hypothetical protein
MSLRACDVDLIRRARAPHSNDKEDDAAVVALRMKLRREMIYEVQDHDYLSGSGTTAEGGTGTTAEKGKRRRIPFPLATATVLSTESSDEESESD